MPLSVSFREMERDWGWKEKKKVTHGRRIARATLEKKKIYISNDIRYCGASGWPKSDRRGDDVSIDRTRERQSAFIIDILVKKKEKKRNHDRSNNSDWFELTLASSFGEEGRFDKKKKWNCWTTKAYRGRYLIIYHASWHFLSSRRNRLNVARFYPRRHESFNHWLHIFNRFAAITRRNSFKEKREIFILWISFPSHPKFSFDVVRPKSVDPSFENGKLKQRTKSVVRPSCKIDKV